MYRRSLAAGADELERGLNGAPCPWRWQARSSRIGRLNSEVVDDAFGGRFRARDLEGRAAAPAVLYERCVSTASELLILSLALR